MSKRSFSDFVSKENPERVGRNYFPKFIGPFDDRNAVAE